MSYVQEESLLSESLSFENLHEPIDKSTLEELNLQKFGIANVHDEVADDNNIQIEKEQTVNGDESFTTSTIFQDQKLDGKTGSLQCNSSANNISLSSNNSSPLISSLNFSKELNKVAAAVPTIDTKHDGNGNLEPEVHPTTSPNFRNGASNNKCWVVFDDNKSIQVPGLESSLLEQTRQPPDIPLRKALPITEPINAVNTLTKDNEQLQDKTRLGSNEDVPPIPDRLLSPRTLVSLTSFPTRPSSTNMEIRLPPPPLPSSSNNSIKRRSRSKSSLPGLVRPSELRTTSPTTAFAPPVPPRRDITMRQSEKGSISDISRTSDTSSQAFIRCEYVGSSQDELLDGVSVGTSATTPSQFFRDVDELGSSISSLNTSSVVKDDSCVQKDSETEDSKTWVSSTPPSSPKSNKKSKKGYQHLSSGSEEEEPKSVIEMKSEVTIKVTDLSPLKPLSRWALIRNEGEDKSTSPESDGARNSDPPDDLELDVDDAFALNIDRLSTDGSVLKGFNRADRGSQNNLVDFSESAEQLDQSSFNGSSTSEDELETVFDMTAQGDSLKRRRKKKTFPDPGTSPSPVCAPSAAAAVSDDKNTGFLSASTELKLDLKSSINQSTNPFWRNSPLGDTSSLASSESNPFDRVQFQSTTIPSPLLKTPKSHIPSLPPPPRSGKHRALSGVVGRPRPHIDSISYSLTTSDSGNDAEDGKRTVSVSSSVFESKLMSSRETPTKSDAVSLLDVANRSDSSSDNVATIKASPKHTSDHAPEVSDGDVASTSKKDSTILETTLQILDGFSKSSEGSLLPVNVDSRDIRTTSPLIVPEAPPLSSLDDLKIAEASGELSQNIGTGLKKHMTLNKEKLISSKSEWEMLMRFPREKRLMSSRKWVSIFVRLKTDLVHHPTLQFFHSSLSEVPFYFISLADHEFQISKPILQSRFESAYELKRERKMTSPDMGREGKSKIGEVEYYSAIKRKVHCIQFYHTHYKEKRSFMTKRDKFMGRSPAGFKHSLKKKQAVKLGTEDYGDLLGLLAAVSDASFRANSLRSVADGEEEDRKPDVRFHSRDEIMFELLDEFMGELSSAGVIESCDVTVHVFVTSFLSGDPMATVTFNDKKVQGKEVVRRSDIIPSSNNSWVDMQDIEVHRSSPRGYDEESAAITFHPPDACRFELARYRCVCTEAEPPITVRPSVHIKRTQVTLRCVLRLSPNHSANEDPLHQASCDDLAIRFPIPESWVPAFRKLARPGLYNSIHAERVRKRPSRRGSVLGGRGVVQGFAAIEASIGDGKYEVAYGAIVWRVKRFPEKNAAHNTPQVFSCVIQLQSVDHLPRGGDLERLLSCQVEYSTSGSTASNSCVRSVSLPNCPRAEKFCSYTAHYLYTVQLVATEEGNEQTYCALQ